MSVTQQLARVRAELPEGVTLVAVSKTHPAELIREAYDAGQRIFGESRPQELREKYELLPKDIEWHMIGHLQTNKVKYIAPFVQLIHSVDSARLAEALSRGDLAGVAANVYNALQRPACQLHAGIAEALAAAASFSPLAYAVTGSGSAVFALFETEELCRWARSRYRGKCKTRVVRTVCPQKGGRGAEPRGPHMPRNPFYLSEEELRRACGKE